MKKIYLVLIIITIAFIFKSCITKEQFEKLNDRFEYSILQIKSQNIEFNWKDIVRSDFVRDYIMTKEMMKK